MRSAQGRCLISKRLERTRGRVGCSWRASVDAGRSTTRRETPSEDAKSSDPCNLSLSRGLRPLPDGVRPVQLPRRGALPGVGGRRFSSPGADTVVRVAIERNLVRVHQGHRRSGPPRRGVRFKLAASRRRWRSAGGVSLLHVLRRWQRAGRQLHCNGSGARW